MPSDENMERARRIQMLPRCGRLEAIAELADAAKAEGRREGAERMRERAARVADKWTADLTAAGDQFDKEGDIYRYAGITSDIATAIREIPDE